MGSPEDEPGREGDELQHEVILTQGFWLGQYPVTQVEFKSIMGANPSWFSPTSQGEGEIRDQESGVFRWRVFLGRMQRNSVAC